MLSLLCLHASAGGSWEGSGRRDEEMGTPSSENPQTRHNPQTRTRPPPLPDVGTVAERASGGHQGEDKDWGRAVHRRHGRLRGGGGEVERWQESFPRRAQEDEVWAGCEGGGPKDREQVWEWRREEERKEQGSQGWNRGGPRWAEGGQEAEREREA
eukprot:7390931-Prymnesium_polylepis.2